MVYTKNYVAPVPYGNDGPADHLGHYRYDTMITTRDCVLSLSDYPDNRHYVPTEKLISDNFGRIIEVTEIEPLKVFNNKEQDELLTFEIIRNILLMTQDRQIGFDTTGRWWSQFALIWRMYSELSRQHLIQIYKGIYRDNDGTSDSVGNTNGSSESTSKGESYSKNTNDSRNNSGSIGTSVNDQESDSDTRNASSTLPQNRVDYWMTPGKDYLDYADNASINLNKSHSQNEAFNTSDSEGHNWGWSIAESQNTSVQKSISTSNNSSSSHTVGMNKGVFAIYDQWVRSYRDMTGGMYYQMTRSGLWSLFIR